MLRVVGKDQECRAGEQAFADGTDASLDFRLK